jgi:putative ABC transport system permease protein
LVVGAPALNQAALRADAFEASYADPSLQAEGIAEGTVIRLGPDRTEVTVVGFVDDIRYAGQGSLWGSLDTWRGVLNINRPGESSGEGVVQALVVRGADGTEGDLTEPIDAATGGSTSTLSIAGAIEALPGVEQQRSVFNQIIRCHGGDRHRGGGAVLRPAHRGAHRPLRRAQGPRRRLPNPLRRRVVLQAVAVTLMASAVGLAASLALSAVIPPGGIPFLVTPSRLASSVAFLLIAAVAGCAFSLRRVLRIDPAAAIGGGQ